MENKTYFDLVRKRQAEGKPLATYTKAIRGKVGVSIIDTFTGGPTELILEGDPRDASVDREDYTLVMWTEFEHEYFRRYNKLMLQLGYIVPAKELEEEGVSVNEISDEELEEVLKQPYFTLKAFLDKVTSEVPVRRALVMAEDMNKTVGTLDAIKAKLSELQYHETEKT